MIERSKKMQLSCRGCTLQCNNKHRCGGFPWQITVESDRTEKIKKSITLIQKNE